MPNGFGNFTQSEERKRLIGYELISDNEQQVVETVCERKK